MEWNGLGRAGSKVELVPFSCVCLDTSFTGFLLGYASSISLRDCIFSCLTEGFAEGKEERRIDG